jgi:ferredoxin
VEVTLGWVEGLRDERGPSTRPLGSFVVGIEDQPGTVAQLEQIGLDDWRFSLGSTEYLDKGCADCGELRCCAEKGFCIECGLCGQVCNEPVARPDPEAEGEEDGESDGDAGRDSGDS